MGILFSPRLFFLTALHFPVSSPSLLAFALQILILRLIPAVWPILWTALKRLLSLCFPEALWFPTEPLIQGLHWELLGWNIPRREGKTVTGVKGWGKGWHFSCGKQLMETNANELLKPRNAPWQRWGVVLNQVCVVSGATREAAAFLFLPGEMWEQRRAQVCWGCCCP